MHGNVWEWVEDIYNKFEYGGLKTDGAANLTIGESDKRILRGGYWINSDVILRSTTRLKSSSSKRDFSFGFRIAARPNEL